LYDLACMRVLYRRGEGVHIVCVLFELLLRVNMIATGSLGVTGVRAHRRPATTAAHPLIPPPRPAAHTPTTPPCTLAPPRSGQGASPSSPPPSAFPARAALAPTPADRRASRTDLDFERALASSGTVQLHESDISILGADALPTPPPKPAARRGTTSSHHHPLPQLPPPGTPIVVPPSPAFADDGAHATRRRSMYRAPGMASSPDLATLVRKTKRERELPRPPDELRARAATSAAPITPDRRLEPNRMRSSPEWGVPTSSTTTTISAGTGIVVRVVWCACMHAGD
jgi:hypothetical protein